MLHKAQYSQTSVILLDTNPDCSIRGWCDEVWLVANRERVSTSRVQWPSALHHPIPCSAGQLMTCGLDVAVCPLFWSWSEGHMKFGVRNWLCWMLVTSATYDLSINWPRSIIFCALPQFFRHSPPAPGRDFNISYTCEHGRDWYTWFHSFEWLFKYFWQYFIHTFLSLFQYIVILCMTQIQYLANLFKWLYSIVSASPAITCMSISPLNLYILCHHGNMVHIHPLCMHRHIK